jgi:hypothetical protein
MSPPLPSCMDLDPVLLRLKSLNGLLNLVFEWSGLERQQDANFDRILRDDLSPVQPRLHFQPPLSILFLLTVQPLNNSLVLNFFTLQPRLRPLEFWYSVNGF